MNRNIKYIAIFFFIVISSMIIHEIGHAIMIYLFGFDLLQIRFFGISINISKEKNYNPSVIDPLSFYTEYKYKALMLKESKEKMLFIHLSGFLFQAIYCFLCWKFLLKPQNKKLGRDTLICLLSFCLLSSLIDIKEALNILFV